MDEHKVSQLMACPSCEKALSPKAFQCPHCGHPNPLAVSRVRVVGGVEIGIVAGMKIGFGFFLTALLLGAVPFVILLVLGVIGSGINP